MPAVNTEEMGGKRRREERGVYDRSYICSSIARHLSVSRHQLPSIHGNPLTLADGLRSNSSQEIQWEHGGGSGRRKVGVMAESESNIRESKSKQNSLWERVALTLLPFFSCAFHTWRQVEICHTQQVSGHRLLKMNSWAGMIIFPSISCHAKVLPQ